MICRARMPGVLLSSVAIFFSRRALSSRSVHFSRRWPPRRWYGDMADELALKNSSSDFSERRISRPPCCRHGVWRSLVPGAYSPARRCSGRWDARGSPGGVSPRSVSARSLPSQHLGRSEEHADFSGVHTGDHLLARFFPRSPLMNRTSLLGYAVILTRVSGANVRLFHGCWLSAR